MSQPEAYCLADAEDGHRGDISAAEHKPSSPGTQNLPVPAPGVAITRANQIFYSDVMYIPMCRGFLNLVAIMDWHSRKIMSWQLSNSMDASFCAEALSEVLERYDTPEIFKTDQWSQFTSTEFVGDLENAGGTGLDGMPWPMDGQHDGRETVAVAEVRKRLPERL